MLSWLLMLPLALWCADDVRCAASALEVGNTPLVSCDGSHVCAIGYDWSVRKSRVWRVDAPQGTPELPVGSPVALDTVAFKTPPMVATRAAEFAFYDGGTEVAALVLDDDLKVCRFEGDMEAAARILFEEFQRVSEERDRLKWGNAQVDRWKRERQRRERTRR